MDLFQGLGTWMPGGLSKQADDGGDAVEYCRRYSADSLGQLSIQVAGQGPLNFIELNTTWKASSL